MAFALMGWSNVWAEYSTSNNKIYFTWDGSSGYTVSFGEGVSGDIAITESMEMTNGTSTWYGTITGISSYSNLWRNTGITSLSINLPSATSIPECAFENCTNLEWIWLPCVTSIGDAAFKGCTKLATVKIPAVTSIASNAFTNCTSLEDVYLPGSAIENGSSSAVDFRWVFYGSSTYMTGLTAHFTSSVTTTYDVNTFAPFDAVVFEKGCESVGDNAFKDVTNITSLSYNTNANIATIGAYSFQGCTGLTTMSFPSTLSSIGNYAFYDCGSLTHIYSESPEITLGTDAFLCYSSSSTESEYYKIPINCTLKVLDGYASGYAKYSFDKEKAWSLWDVFYTNHNIHELSYPYITTAGWGTYYNTYGYIMPEGVEGYIISGTSDGKATLVKVYDAGQEVVANIALLWKATEDLADTKYYTVEALASGGGTATWPVDGESNAYMNLLCGSQAGGTTTAWGTESSNYYYYKLANGSSGLGWYFGSKEKVDDNYTGQAFTSGAHKAWLVVAKSAPAGARSFISLDFGGTTSIESVVKKAESNDALYYNLQGQRVENPTKGLYIVNGKKVIIK